jgi:pimeloyl-ACP methyl ester carboxylesterase
MRREVRYTPAGDVRIAYQVLGADGPDLVFVPGSPAWTGTGRRATASTR